jgi:GSH-dependent disulfide-bond oxidoreductase
MIDLYASTTPNVLKIEIMLEETGLPYALKPVNVWKGEQFEEDFVRLNPNSKVPVIVDHDLPGGFVVFESAAILFYLAEKTGRFLPASGKARHDVMQWLIFQAANLGPMNGQFNHFDLYAEPGNDYSLSRYTTELKRQYGVMERRLGDAPYLGGEEYSIADMAAFPWVLVQSNRLREKYPFLDKESPLHPNIAAWVKRCEARPGVQRGLKAHSALKSGVPTATPDDLDRIFGRGDYAYRPSDGV